jgi:23S rRNA (uracil1939-C5)-methyltransferase
VFGGEVLAHAPDGRVVLLRGAAPGDVVEVRVTEARPRLLRAEVVRRIAAGAGAVEPFCPLVARCGGCPWQGIDPAVQIAALDEHVRRALGRAAGQGEPPRFLPPVSGAARGWRSTVRMRWEGGRLGFREAGSHALTDVPECPVVTPEVAALLAEVRADLLPALRGAGTLRLTAAPGAASGTVALEPERPGDAPPDRVAAFVRTAKHCHGAVMPGRAFGDPVNRFGGVPHPAGSFVQAHQPGNAFLVAAVVEAAGPPGEVLELFAGSGNFTLALAAAGHRVTAVESDPAAVERLRTEAGRRGLGDRVAAIHGDAGRPPARAPLIVLDPPRAGFRQLPAVASGARRVVYVSCDPATLARDVTAMVQAGWRLEEARVFDLFPHTGHAEALAVLGRPGDD